MDIPAEERMRRNKKSAWEELDGLTEETFNKYGKSYDDLMFLINKEQ